MSDDVHNRKDHMDLGSDVNLLVSHARSRVVVMDMEEWRGKLESFLEEQPEVKGKVVVTDIERAETGASSGNLQFTAQLDLGEGPCLNRFSVRYHPTDSFFPPSNYDLVAQFKIQKALQGTGVPAPNPLWLDSTGESLGVPGFIMEYKGGTAPS